jgi:sigma54-dependent transcription regulator
MEPLTIPQNIQSGGDEELAAGCGMTTILITASTAADVETLARRIHAAARGMAPFVHVPAAELPIEPAAFRDTCADLLEAATGGTLLLTGIDNTPAVVQNRLIETLDLLQGARERSAAVRLMAGTTTSLYECVADGRFSERLFYRLNVIHVVASSAAALGHDPAQEGARPARLEAGHAERPARPRPTQGHARAAAAV